MKKFLKSLSVELTAAGIIFAVTLFLQYRDQDDSQAKRSIDCWEKLDFGSIDSTEAKEVGMQFLHHGKAFYGFTTANVEIYNYSDRDFDNIKVRIEIIPKKGDSLSMIQPDVTGPHGKSVGLKVLKDNSKRAGDGRIIYEYLIEPANRADSLKDVLLDATYALTSMEEPKLEVSISGKGIIKDKWNQSHFQKRSWWEENKFNILLILGAIIFIFIYIKFIVFMIKRRNERWRIYLHKHLSERINAGKVKYDADSIITVHRYISDKFDYDDTSTLMRKIKRLKPPENKDLF